MPDLMQLMGGQPAGGPTQPPQALPTQGEARQGGGNPLAALLGQQQQPQPQPQMPMQTMAQTTAAMHHFSTIKSAFKPILNDPKLGKVNIRPRILDSMSKLMGSQTLSLPEVMNALKALPDDPQEQVKFVEKIYTDNSKAQQIVLQNYEAGLAMRAADAVDDEYSQDNHGAMMEALMKHYGNGRQK